MQNEKWQVADAFEYNVLKANARANRNNQTEAESVFWSLAKASGLGEKCRRQYIIGQYIVDFFFRKSMLIVELDGGYHRPSQPPLKGGKVQWYNDPEQIIRDKERQDWLEHQGYSILRFTNEQILFDTENSIQRIKENIKI